MSDSIEPFQVSARLNLKGSAEFTGLRHQVDGTISTGLRVCGVDLTFTDPTEADRFAAAAQVMAAQLHIAHDRNEIRRTA